MNATSIHREVDETARAIFEAIADPIFVIFFVDGGLDERFCYVNEAACRLLGRTREELMTLRPGSVDEISDEVMDVAFAQMMTEGRATFESLMIASDGRRIPVEIHASDAQLSGRRTCIAVARSLVARKEADARLRESKEAAEVANRAKSEFLAMMSHEIRTPLHGVVGFASLLETANLPTMEREAVDGIRDSANLLLALVTDVLDFSKIEAGQLELQPTTVDLGVRLRRFATAIRLRAEEQGLVFRYLEAPSLPRQVRIDALRLEQVLGNLLGNALKFTNRGSITLEVTTYPGATPGELALRFAVTDTGIGIQKESLPRLFQPFSQADSSAARPHGGTGLGLVIVKRLCELMGGTVTVRSEYGAGSVFTASVIARVEEASKSLPLIPSDSELPEDGASRLRVLIAEDNMVSQRLMKRMMERLGYDAQFASNGFEVLEMTRATRYDLVLMDINMPGMSGLDATRLLRTREAALKLQPSIVVALTAGVSPTERQTCIDAGMDDFLGKPFTEAGLHATLDRINNRSPGGGRR